MSKRFILASACAGVVALASASYGQVVINEFQYDDTGTADDREFIELFNAGSAPVDIGNWTVGGRDPTTTNTTITIPAGTMIAPGGYYVIGNTGVLNLNQTAAAGFLENDNETIELSSPSGVVDALAYETNKGVAFAAPVSSQVGPGIFGNNQGSDLAGTPLNASVSVGRFVDGRDTNNNGRDFGMRPSTPGSSNAPGGTMVLYTPPAPSGAVGSDMPGMTGSFVNPRVIDPTVADANNPNAIAPSPITGNRAYVAWDPSGGGNGATSNAVFNTGAAGFQISAYLDTRDLPQQSNATGVNFTGSEITIYGVGGGDPLTNLTDLTGAVGLGAVVLPAAESANGFTGVAWVYEKVALSGTTPVSEMLHLVDANDGGDSDTGGNTPLDWTILQSIDLSSIASDWYNLGITVDAAGNGVANFNGQTFTFTTTGMNSGAFNVGYRENLQVGSDPTPDALMRPATFTVVPEPATLGLLAAALPLVARRRRR
jgi:hypothetical protein